MSDDATLRAEIDELLKDVKEKERKSYEFKRAAERQLSCAISAYVVAPPRSMTYKKVDKESGDNCAPK